MDLVMPTFPVTTLEAIKKEAVIQALARHQGNRTRTARELDVSTRYIQRKIISWHLPRKKRHYVPPNSEPGQATAV